MLPALAKADAAGRIAIDRAIIMASMALPMRMFMEFLFGPKRHHSETARPCRSKIMTNAWRMTFDIELSIEPNDMLDID